MKTLPAIRFVLKYVYVALVVFALGILFDRLIPPHHSWEHDLHESLVRAAVFPLVILFIQGKFKDQRH